MSQKKWLEFHPKKRPLREIQSVLNSLHKRARASDDQLILSGGIPIESCISDGISRWISH